MSSFIEWRTTAGHKTPWMISNAQHALAVAALWDVWDGDGSQLLSCTLVTTAAAPQFEPWHKRMPVVLADEEWQRWLDNSQVIAANDPLFRSELKSEWYLQELPKSVGNARNKNPSEMEGLGELIELRP